MIFWLDDDCDGRTTPFLNLINGTSLRVSRVETAAAAISFFTDLTEKVSVAFLDHDLGGEVFVDTSREDCGMEVIRWLEKQEKKPEIETFVVHSFNTSAAMRMVDRLKGMGYEAHYLPFRSIQFDDVCDQLRKL